MRVPSVALVTALTLLAAGSALAQGLHPLLRPVRPPHERLALSDAVAIATVGEVTPDRYRMRDARVLVGRAGEAFEVKRSASSRLPLQPGDRALLFLRGARSPYLAVDRAAELPVLEGAASEQAWASAVEQLARAGDDVRMRADLYAGWIDHGDASLRALGAASLRDPAGGYAALGDAFFERRARRVFDPSLPLEVRRTWAEVLVWSRAGAGVLADGALPCRPGIDAALLVSALTAARVHGLPQRDALRECAVRHEDPTVRRVAERGDPGASR